METESKGGRVGGGGVEDNWLEETTVQELYGEQRADIDSRPAARLGERTEEENNTC